ncbi:hypothetical protein [Rhodanobacter soli]
MNTSPGNVQLEQALNSVPKIFRSKLVASYLELKTRAMEGRLDSAGLSAGKFCEVTVRILQHAIFGEYTPFGTQIRNFADECRKLVSAPATAGHESLRVVVPRALVFIYTMRNKRGIGHVGGDIDPNKIDLATIARSADWVVCELIRNFHSLSLEEAQDIVDGISVRQLPDIWEVGGKKRVLRIGLTAKKEVLLLLYSDPASVVLAEDLNEWVEYASLALLRRDVLQPLHKSRLIEFDRSIDAVYISPLGIAEVEANILPNAATKSTPKEAPRRKIVLRRKVSK